MIPAPLILFAPGAGAPSTSRWMSAWQHRLGELGTVKAFDYPYMLAGRRRPDPAPKLIEAHLQALREARKDTPSPIVLAGKSMGARIGCHVATATAVDALVCFGYPLRAPGSGKMRDEVLLQLSTPILFIQGTRDALCPLELLEDVRQRMRARNVLHVVEGGDHSLEVTKGALKKAGLTQEDVDRRILRAVAEFLAPVSGSAAVP